MVKLPLHVSKIVSTSTPNAWSQAYNAGGLFAVISLVKDDVSSEKNSLPSLGKELVSTIEAEFFSLQEKSLSGISTCVETAAKKIPGEIKGSIMLAAIIDGVLYGCISGEGRLLMARNGKLGSLLKTKENEIESGSGFLEDLD